MNAGAGRNKRYTWTDLDLTRFQTQARSVAFSQRDKSSADRLGIDSFLVGGDDVNRTYLKYDVQSKDVTELE